MTLAFSGCWVLINLIVKEDMRGGAELILLATFDKGTHVGAWGRSGPCLWPLLDQIRAGK